MSPLPCAVIGIICYLWSHNKVCHGAFSVIIFLFVSLWDTDTKYELDQSKNPTHTKYARRQSQLLPVMSHAANEAPASSPRPAPTLCWRCSIPSLEIKKTLPEESKDLWPTLIRAPALLLTEDIVGTELAESSATVWRQDIQKGLLIWGTQLRHLKGPEFRRADTHH